jgi:hypothetical protein
MKTIYRCNLDQFLNARRKDGKFFGAWFVKADGSIRPMNCKGKIAYTGAKKSGRKANDNLISLPHRRVWDRNVKGWRKVNLATMIYVTFQGEKYLVV